MDWTIITTTPPPTATTPTPTTHSQHNETKIFTSSAQPVVSFWDIATRGLQKWNSQRFIIYESVTSLIIQIGHVDGDEPMPYLLWYGFQGIGIISISINKSKCICFLSTKVFKIWFDKFRKFLTRLNMYSRCSMQGPSLLTWFNFNPNMDR